MLVLCLPLRLKLPHLPFSLPKENLVHPLHDPVPFSLSAIENLLRLNAVVQGIVVRTNEMEISISSIEIGIGSLAYEFSH